MAKTFGSQRSTDSLLQVAGFLKQADKLVRERNYTSALDQIAKARAKDPNNSYAEAYEQRVMLLLCAFKENKQPKNSLKDFTSETPLSFSRHLESIANLAILEAHRTANLSLKQESLEQQVDDTKIVSPGGTVRIPLIEKQTIENRDTQVLGCIRLAEELFLKRKLDEALNTLAPAILLDPLNKAILELEHRIHDSQEQEIVSRLRQPKPIDNEHQKIFHEGNLEIQKCIVRATHLTERKEFSQALMVIGQGYLVDPFNELLATCEKTVLSELAKETQRIDGVPLTIHSHGSKHSGRKPEILRCLNNAETLLDEDRFAESLSQVAMAMIALQRREEPRENESGVSNPVERVTHESSERDDSQTAKDQMESDNARNIFGLLDKAKQLAWKEEYEEALDVLLNASFVIPSNGSLDHLNREIARNFMEYFLLLRQERGKQSIGDQSSSVNEVVRKSNNEAGEKIEIKKTEKNPGTIQSKQHSSHDLEFQFESDDPLSETPHDRILQTRDHLMRSLRHLDQMHLVEASVEGEIAALVDDSRKDIASYASTVSALARMAKSQTALSALDEQHGKARFEAKDLIQRLCYEEILGGIDQVVQAIPMNNSLLKRRKEVEQSLEEFELSPLRLQESTQLKSRPSKRNVPSAVKSKKNSLAQMGLTFDGGLGSADDLETSQSGESAEIEDGVPVQKPARRRNPISSTSQYLGN